MINTFASSRQSTKLNGIRDSDNEHLLELTSDELSELHGGWRGIVTGIATEIVIEIGKAIWASRSSSEVVTTYDCPPGGYHGA
jgi:hypothetical protein